MTVPFPVRAVPRLARRAWFTPPPIGSRTIERDRESVSGLQSFRAGDVSGFETGTGPLVLALHGWGGRPAQMTALSLAFASAGYRVVIPQLPGHAGGAPTDVKEAATAVDEVLAEVGEPAVLVAHSLASIVSRLVFANRPSPGIVLFFAPAHDVNDVLEVFSDRLRLLPWTRNGLRRRIETWDPRLWPEISDLHIDQFPGSQIHIFHDPADADTSFARSAELAFRRPATHMHVASNVGHSKVLVDPDVIGSVLNILAGPQPGS